MRKRSTVHPKAARHTDKTAAVLTHVPLLKVMEKNKVWVQRSVPLKVEETKCTPPFFYIYTLFLFDSKNADSSSLRSFFRVNINEIF